MTLTPEAMPISWRRSGGREIPLASEVIEQLRTPSTQFAQLGQGDRIRAALPTVERDVLLVWELVRQTQIDLETSVGRPMSDEVDRRRQGDGIELRATFRRRDEADIGARVSTSLDHVIRHGLASPALVNPKRPRKLR
jgi:hypothetical protein